MDGNSHAKKVPVDPRVEAEAPGAGHVGWKPITMLGVGCLTVSSLLLLGMIAAMSFGLASCVSSCSDRPIRDTRETASFIAAREANERDVKTFDALRSAIDAVYERLERYASDAEKSERSAGDVTHPMAVDELRSAVAAGSWPTEPAGFGGPDSSLSPQLWVRIAELSQDYLERETGESWEVVDFSYPFPSSGPVPVPATRDEDSRTLTLLRCTRGQDEGRHALVGYYRWRRSAEFVSDLDERRGHSAQARELLEKLEGMDQLRGRRFLLDNGEVYIWETGEGDSLREPDAFVALANEITRLTGTFAHVRLLASDTPATLVVDPISRDYPNKLPSEAVDFDRAREQLLLSDPELKLGVAIGDELFEVYRRSEDADIVVNDVGGVLSGRQLRGASAPAMKPDADCRLDEGFCELVAKEVGAPSASDVIALCSFSRQDYPGSKVGFADESLSAFVLVPRGYLPETKEGFCSMVDQLRDAFWDEIPQVESHRTSLALRIFVIDQNTIKDPDGKGISFAQLRELVGGDPTKLKDCTVDVLLGVMPFSTRWEHRTEREESDCRPKDVGGSIAKSREWAFE